MTKGWYQIKLGLGNTNPSARHLFHDGYRICQRWAKSVPAADQDPDAPKCGQCLRILQAPSRANQYVDPDNTPPPAPKPKAQPQEEPKRIPTVAERVEALRLEKLRRAFAQKDH